MTSKEKLKAIKDYFWNEREPNYNAHQFFKDIEKDLEEKEKQDKILERLKRPLFYSQRKKLGEEFLNWAEENKVSKTDLTNIITWCFCFKLKEWLNEKNV